MTENGDCDPNSLQASPQRSAAVSLTVRTTRDQAASFFGQRLGKTSVTLVASDPIDCIGSDSCLRSWVGDRGSFLPVFFLVVMAWCTRTVFVSVQSSFPMFFFRRFLCAPPPFCLQKTKVTSRPIFWSLYQNSASAHPTAAAATFLAHLSESSLFASPCVASTHVLCVVRSSSTWRARLAVAEACAA